MTLYVLLVGYSQASSAGTIFNVALLSVEGDETFLTYLDVFACLIPDLGDSVSICAVISPSAPYPITNVLFLLFISLTWLYMFFHLSLK